MGIAIAAVVQFLIVCALASAIRKYVPGARALTDAYPGLVALALFLVAVESMHGRKHISIFPFMFAGFFAAIFISKIYEFIFSLLSGEWRRSWFILDSLCAISILLGGLSSELMAQAKAGGWLYGIIMIPFILATIGFETSRAITSRLYLRVEGKAKAFIKVAFFYSYLALGVGTLFALDHVAIL